MTYTLTVPTPDIQDAGVSQQSVDDLGRKPVCIDSNDVVHCFACFGINPTYIHYVNSTGEASAQFWSGGSAGAGCRHVAYNPYNNKMYLGGHFLFEVDLNTSPPTFTVLQSSLGTSGSMGVSNGGKVWYIDYYSGGVFYMYDPVVGMPSGWKNYGIPLTPAGNYEYASVGADDNYIYCACVSSAPYRSNQPDVLFYCPIEGTPNWQAWPYNSDHDENLDVSVDQGTTNWVVRRQLSGGSMKYYTPNGGTFTERGAWTGHNDGDAPLYCIFDAGDPNLEDQPLFGWYFYFSALVPIKDVWEYTMIDWNDGSTNYYQSQLSFAATAFIDNNSTNVLGISNSKLMITGQGYAAVVQFDYLTETTTYLGADVLSPYTLKMHPTSGEIYCGGYTNKVWRFDPAYPLTADQWTFNPSYTITYDPGDSPKPNPYFINLGSTTSYMLHYRLFIEFDAAGLVWIGGNTVRLGTNYGDVMWYNPVTGASDYMFPSWVNTYQVRSMCSANNGATLCVADNSGQIWLVNTATKSVDGTPYVPVTATGACWIIEVATDVVLGIYMLGTTYKVFTFQPSTKTDIVSAKDFGVGISGFPFGWEDGENNRRQFKLELGPDGFVWMFVGSTIYRIDPSDCSFSSIATLPQPNKLKFSQNNTDLVIYYGTNDVKYIPGIFSYAADYSRGSYISLPAYDADLDTPYTGDDIIDVATDDTDMVGQLATSQISIHQFKQQINGTGGIISVVAQVTIPCSTSTAYLQIYNHSGTPAWETIDFDDATGANTDFTLSASVADLTDYKDENNIVACRVYQEMQ